MGWQDLIAISIALAALVCAVRLMWRTFCGQEDCGSCPTAAASKSKLEVPQLRRTPLVSLTTPQKTSEPQS